MHHYRRICSMKNLALFSTLFIWSAAAPAKADILYSSNDDFDNVTGSTGNLVSVAGWASVYGNAATNATAATPSGTYKSGVFDGSNSGLNDYLYFQKDGGLGAEVGMDFFAHTSTGSTFTPFAPDDYTAGLTASWLRNGNNADGYYVTVEVAGAWYASTTDMGTAASPTFDFLSTSWREVFGDVGTPLTLSGATTSSAALFAGQDITGVGFFVDDLIVSSGNTTLRLDNIAIVGVPEPSAALLGLLGVAGVAIAIRRRLS